LPGDRQVEELDMEGSIAKREAASDERFRLLVESVKDYGIFMLDKHGNIASWNSGAERIAGYSADEIIGKHFSIFYTEEDKRAGKPQRELEIAGAKGRYEEEGWRVRKDGSMFWVYVAVTALRDKSNILKGFAKVTRDLTERKKAEEELRQSEERLRKLNDELECRVEQRTKQLEEINRELEAFCYSVSHDLRAPLRGMMGFAEALKEDYAASLPEEASDYIARISRASKKMEALIEDLLEYSRLSREDIRVRPIFLRIPVDEALSQVASQIEDKGARVQVDKRLPRVLAHRATLARILANLISNGVKFVPEEKVPEVHVYTEPTDGKVRLYVVDNGIGIKPEHQDRIFRVFERLHGVEKYSGTGVGLAIVRKGIERMGGKAGVESQLGAGSRFWIELPAAGET
jgi:PAS domain S-box-containing protein